MTGSSFEITGSGTDEGLSFTDDALTASPADAAVGVHDDGPARRLGNRTSLFRGFGEAR